MKTLINKKSKILKAIFSLTYIMFTSCGSSPENIQQPKVDSEVSEVKPLVKIPNKDKDKKIKKPNYKELNSSSSSDVDSKNNQETYNKTNNTKGSEILNQDKEKITIEEKAKNDTAKSKDFTSITPLEIETVKSNYKDDISLQNNKYFYLMSWLKIAIVPGLCGVVGAVPGLSVLFFLLMPNANLFLVFGFTIGISIIGFICAFYVGFKWVSESIREECKSTFNISLDGKYAVFIAWISSIILTSIVSGIIGFTPVSGVLSTIFVIGALIIQCLIFSYVLNYQMKKAKNTN